MRSTVRGRKGEEGKEEGSEEKGLLLDDRVPILLVLI
jgi:hypothetical protein